MIKMIKMSLAIIFILAILPVLVLMIGMAIWTNVKAKEVDLVLDHNRDIYEQRVKDLTERGV